MRLSNSVDDLTAGQINKNVSAAPSITRRISSWDEDWVPARTAQTPIQSSTTASVSHPSVLSQPSQLSPTGYSTLRPISVASTQQPPPSSCPAIDVEWPPQSAMSVGPQFGDLTNPNRTNSGLDEIDPFANWPPSVSNNDTPALSSSNSFEPSINITNTANGLSYQSSSWDFETTQGTSSSLSIGSNMGLQNALGYMKQNTVPSSNASLESIFPSNRNASNIAPRLAPPPLGRGVSLYEQMKSKNEKPLLPDLL